MERGCWRWRERASGAEVRVAAAAVGGQRIIWRFSVPPTTVCVAAAGESEDDDDDGTTSCVRVREEGDVRRHVM